MTSDSLCFHCGLANSSENTFPSSIAGELRHFCCLGCQSVASLLHESGFDKFYSYREKMSSELTEQEQDFLRKTAEGKQNYSAYDQVDLQQEFVEHLGEGRYRADLLIEGVHCAACTWLLEEYLTKQAGVKKVSVNLATHRCQLEWDSKEILLSTIMGVIHSLGYQALPASAEQHDLSIKKENRLALLRLGVAGVGMVQVGSFSIALYAGALQDMSEEWQVIFRWISAVVATPIVLFSAKPFFMGAWRSLRVNHLTMDVSIALAVGLAYVASLWATVSNTGDVYFDSVAMFTFFLLLGRYLEMRIRHGNEQSINRLNQVLPHYSELVEKNKKDFSVRPIPVNQIVVGDQLWIREGETIPVDGRVIKGESHVNESMLSGEAKPIEKKTNDKVLAGTVNISEALVVEVEFAAKQTRLSAIQRVMEKAIYEKPPEVSRADKIAGYFVAGVIFFSLGIGIFWWFYSPQDTLWVVLSVLVVTCPCALSLATPIAITAATYRMRAMGLLILKPHAVETLSRVSRVVFDKTGTLTQGDMSIKNICRYSDMSQSDILDYVVAMEMGSRHPIASAFEKARRFQFGKVVGGDPGSVIKPRDHTPDNIKSNSGQGIEAEINGLCFRLGRFDFIFDDFCSVELKEKDKHSGQSQYSTVWFASSNELIASFEIEDALRNDSVGLITALKKLGITSEILSGDEKSIVKMTAEKLFVAEYSAALLPEEKLIALKAKQETGDCVAMVGDGLNDLPVLGGADVSIAMAGATDLAHLKSDCVLLHNRILVIEDAILCAKQCTRVIKQNLSWALCYNLLALPLAAMGLIPPYLAALGMSLSSLLVVVNGARLYRFEKQT